MAKAATKSAETTAPAAETDFVWLDAPAETARRVGASESPEVAAIRALPAPKDGKFGAKVYPIPQPAATITDAAEREKAIKEEGRKMTNRFSGIVRRLAKKDAALAYTIRTSVLNDVPVVIVYRVAPKPADTPQAA